MITTGALPTTTGGQQLKIFTGSAHRALAEEIAEFLQVPVGRAKLQRFPDTEVSFQIDENIRGTDVFVVQPTGTCRNSAISSVSARCAEPEKIFSCWPPVVGNAPVVITWIPLDGWGGRIRTSEYGIQSPAPYRLATPQRGSWRGPRISRLGSHPVRDRLARTFEAQPQGAAHQACPQEVKSSRFQAFFATGRDRRS